MDGSVDEMMKAIHEERVKRPEVIEATGIDRVNRHLAIK
jgi:hypothetical protein